MLINNESEFSLELFCENNIHVRENRDKSFLKKYFIFFLWSRSESNWRPPECHSGALPTELRPLKFA